MLHVMFCRIDGDTVLMRDVYPATVLVGYQFILRWTNAHAMWVKRASPLSARILDTLMTMPLNHPRLKEDIIEKVGAGASESQLLRGGWLLVVVAGW